MPGPTTASKNTSGFDPRSIGSCQLWLDASDLSAVTGSSPVSAWRDKSLNTLTSSTTSVTGTNVLTPNAINGLSAILLNGSSSLTGLTTGSGTTLTVCIVGTQSNTCAVSGGLVCLGRSGFADNTDAGSLAITNSTPLGSGLMVSTRTSVNSQIVNTGGTGLTNGSSASPFVYILVNDGTFVNTYLNGTVQTTENISRAGTFAYTNYVIGGRAGSTTNVFYTGYIGEVLIFNSALTSTQINQVQGYLGWKWKTNATMAITNPFFRIQPVMKYFNPNDINSCFVWLDGADTSTMTPNNPIGGTSITAWRDKSLNTVNYINGAGSIPNYVANNLIAPTYASGGGILFNPSLSGTFTNGTTQGFAAVGGFQLNITGFTAIVLARANGTTIFSYNSYFSWSGTGQFLDFDANGSTTWTSISTDSGANANVTDYQTNFTLPNSVSIQCLQGTTTGAFTYINGSVTELSSKVWSYTQTGTPVSSNVWIGNQAPGNRTFSGTIYELILYNTALSLLQRQQVEGYLANKWNIRSTLPATHPFRYFPPSTALPFSPTNLNNCVLWLDGADPAGTGVVPGTGTLATWVDKSGNGFNASSQLTAATSTQNAVNGLNSISFNGTSRYLTSVTGFTNTEYTIFVVQYTTSITGAVGSSGYQRTVHGSTGNQYVFIGTYNGNVATFSGSGSAWNDITANSPNVYNYNSSRIVCMQVSGSILSPYTDGSSQTTKTGTTGSFSSFYIGNDNANTQPWYGFISEIIIYTRVLSTQERQKVEGYLSEKWGLNKLLPTTHLYKLFPPAQETLVLIIPGTIATVTLSALSGSGGTITWTTSTNATGYKWRVGTTFPTALASGTVGAVLTTAVSYAFVASTNYIAWVIPVSSTATDGATTQSATASYSSIVPLSPTILNTITTYLRSYMAEFRNPSFYGYTLNGTAYNISDGGGDMYDTGNWTNPWLLAGTQNTGASSVQQAFTINYGATTATTVDTTFIYASLGYTQGASGASSAHPLTVLGYRTTTGNPVGFQVAGNSGADGGGTLASGILYAGTVLSGFTVHAFYRETYNAGDPSHCNLFILLGHTTWGSVFGTISSFADPVANGGNGAYFFTSGAGVSNILAVQTLLSKSGGALVSAAECQTVVQAFANRIKLSLGL
jgi:hypothetical protein